ncbi:hypothetical protein [Succinimonas amylolytica]|uniref:hypothetical protein n=1 Tax=Succinimonas amylolytica TaxID=83769 RepID=UPI0023A87C62
MNIPEHARCPGCSGNMTFDIGKQALVCESCGLSLTVPDYDRLVTEKARSNVSLTEAADRIIRTHERQNNPDRLYTCRSCGGLIRPGALSASDSCPFCNNAIVFSDKYRDQAEPDYIIPFKKDRAHFEEVCRNIMEKGLFVPEEFRTAARPENIRAVYVPFWIYDADVDDRAKLAAETVELVKNSFVHDLFEGNVAGHTEFRGVPQDASRDVPDKITHTLEPYLIKDAVPFNFAYLAGLEARIYDANHVQGFRLVKERILYSSVRLLTGRKFDNIRILDRDCQVRTRGVGYALFPVWTMTMVWEGRNYTFAMNGQTGTSAGLPPADVGLMNLAGYAGGMLLFLPAGIFWTYLALSYRFNNLVADLVFVAMASILLLTSFAATALWKRYAVFAGRRSHTGYLKAAIWLAAFLFCLDTGIHIFREEFWGPVAPGLLFLIALGLGGIIRDFFRKYVRKEQDSLALKPRTDADAYAREDSLRIDRQELRELGRYWNHKTSMTYPRPKYWWLGNF